MRYENVSLLNKSLRVVLELLPESPITNEGQWRHIVHESQDNCELRELLLYLIFHLSYL